MKPDVLEDSKYNWGKTAAAWPGTDEYEKKPGLGENLALAGGVAGVGIGGLGYAASHALNPSELTALKNYSAIGDMPDPSAFSNPAQSQQAAQNLTNIYHPVASAAARVRPFGLPLPHVISGLKAVGQAAGFDDGSINSWPKFRDAYQGEDNHLRLTAKGPMTSYLHWHRDEIGDPDPATDALEKTINQKAMSMGMPNPGHNALNLSPAQQNAVWAKYKPEMNDNDVYGANAMPEDVRRYKKFFLDPGLKMQSMAKHYWPVAAGAGAAGIAGLGVWAYLHHQRKQQEQARRQQEMQ